MESPQKPFSALRWFQASPCMWVLEEMGRRLLHGPLQSIPWPFSDLPPSHLCTLPGGSPTSAFPWKLDLLFPWNPRRKGAQNLFKPPDAEAAGVRTAAG